MKEKHITVVEPTFEKLEEICKKEVRSKRAVVTRLINAEHVKMKGKKC